MSEGTNPRTDDPCGVNAILAAVEEKDCAAFSRVLGAAATRARDDEQIECEAFLWLLANATSLHLQVHDPSEPYVPMMVLRDRRTAAIEDYTAEELDRLRSSIPFIAETELRARLCDILWERQRDHQMASMAVSAYVGAALQLEDPDSWPPCIDRLDRAAQLARALGKNRPELQQVTSTAWDLLTKHRGEDPLYMSARLIEILLQNQAGDLTIMASIANRAANLAQSVNDWDKARTYLELKSQCLEKSGDKDASREEALNAVDTFVAAADAAADAGSHVLVTLHLQHAIEALRHIPNTKSQVEELHRRLLQHQKQSVNEFRPSSFTVDTTEVRRGAVEEVSGKSWEQAFVTFARLVDPLEIAPMRDQAERSVRDHPLQHLLSSMKVNSEGKVIARRPGMNLFDTESQEIAVEAKMSQFAVIHHRFTGESVLNPARLQIREEHNIDADSLLSLISRSSFVPPGRELIFASGIEAGFRGDFVTAVHLLGPQIENSVRHVLVLNGFLASSLSSQGIQKERDLNHLLYQPYAEQVFGEDLVFDMRTLLVNPHGENLRNRMAHGLMSASEFATGSAVYLWWLTINMIVGFYPPERTEQAEEEEGDEQ